MATKILIADDHGILREAIASLLNNEFGMEVIGEADLVRGFYSIIIKGVPENAQGTNSRLQHI